MLLVDPLLRCCSCGRTHDWSCICFGLLIEYFYLFCPPIQWWMFGKLCFKFMNGPKKVPPTALMKTCIGIVGSVKVRNQYALKQVTIGANKLLNDLTSPAFS